MNDIARARDASAAPGRAWAICLAAVLLWPGAPAQGRQAGEPAEAEKLRVLVDKVLGKGFAGLTTPELVKETAGAGFNVLSPRAGGDSEPFLRELAAEAGKHGISCMPWMRGTLIAKRESRLVLKSGQVVNIASPNSEELWDWMSGLILMHARISKESPALLGVFLDYEIYAEPWIGWAYPLSYDQKVLDEFAAARGVEIPKLPPDKRCHWLEENRLHEAFSLFQVESWRGRCRELRRKVDQINPRFRFCIYPGPKSPFISKAALPEWTSESAPVIFANVDTYGRPPWFGRDPEKPHEEALLANRELLRKEREFLLAKGLPFVQMGGIDPAVRGADPEFCGRNAAMMSQAADGYWIFYEGPKASRPDHAEYWKWFKLANRAIIDKDLEFWRQPRQGQDLFDGHRIDPKTDRLQIGHYGLSAEVRGTLQRTNRYEPHELRGTSADYLARLDAAVFQGFSYAPWQAKKAGGDFKTFVEQGGRLLLAHDSAAMVGDIFPNVARLAPAREGGDGYGRLSDGLLIAAGKPIGVDLKTRPFITASATYWTFKPGPEGVVAAGDERGAAVCVVGLCGKGKVAFVGCKLDGLKDPGSPEGKLLLGILDWLARDIVPRGQ